MTPAATACRDLVSNLPDALLYCTWAFFCHWKLLPLPYTPIYHRTVLDMCQGLDTFCSHARLST